MPKAMPVKLLPLDEYDLIIVSYSGGKDSLACLLALLENGVPRDKIQLWHQRIDGGHDDPSFMDWPVTEAYCAATGEALGIDVRVLFQWKEGGFLGELLKEKARTKGTYFEAQSGEIVYIPTDISRAKISTRRRFPQVSADLGVRWCSSVLKIDVARKAITNDPDLKDGKYLFVTGERAEESTAREKMSTAIAHAADGKRRLVHQWRAVHDWKEQQVWDIIKDWNIDPHPCYKLGFSRCSCIACIFGNANQWASVRELDYDRFEWIASLEEEFGVTIKRNKSVRQLADEGEPYDAIFSSRAQRKLAMRDIYSPKDIMVKGLWELPAGAFGESAGPS